MQLGFLKAALKIVKKVAPPPPTHLRIVGEIKNNRDRTV